MQNLVIKRLVDKAGTVTYDVDHQELIQYMIHKEVQCKGLAGSVRYSEETIALLTEHILWLAEDWDAYRKDPSNIRLHANVATDVQNLTGILHHRGPV